MAKKRKELSTDARDLIIKSYQKIKNISKLARIFKIPKSTVYFILRRFHERGDIENRPRTGRPSNFTKRDKSALLRAVKSNRQKSLSNICGSFNKFKDQTFSEATIRRKITALGFVRRPAKKQVGIGPVNRRKRVTWCRERKSWGVTSRWQQWIFSDESQVVLSDEKKVYVWRRSDEAHNPQLVCPASRRKISLMIWGCVTYDGVGTLTPVNGTIDAQAYINILDDNLWPVIAKNFADKPYVFQDDNAPVHRARSVMTYMEENHVNTTTWPAQSPDLNIIENVWLHIKRELKNVSERIGSKQQLFEEIQTIWENVSVDYVRQLYETIPSRISEVIRMKGHMSKY